MPHEADAQAASNKTAFEEATKGGAMKSHQHPVEFIKVGDVLVRLEEYRRAHPLSANQIADNMAGLLKFAGARKNRKR